MKKLLCLLILLITTPACMRKRFKPLSLLTLSTLKSEERNKFTVHATLLSQEEIKDYLNLDWTEQSLYSAWLMKFYNDTDTIHFINSQSWSIPRIKENVIGELIHQKYEYANYIAEKTQLGLAIAALPSAVAASSQVLTQLVLVTASLGILIPLAPINPEAFAIVFAAGLGITLVSLTNSAYINYCINHHIDALNKCLLLPRFSIAPRSTLQGIVLLDRDALYESWSLVVYDKYDQEQSFRFSTH